MTRRDEAASSVVGALVVLSILSASLVYVNAYHVPRQGATLEVAAREDAEAALLALAARLAAPPDAPVLADVPLRARAPDPPLMAGVVLSPVRASGTLSFAPEGTRVALSHLVAAPAGGIPADDPIRQAAPGGLMRVYALGNATEGYAVGALRLEAPAAYLEGAAYRMEAGALLVQRDAGSSLAASPSLSVARAGTGATPTTAVSWRIPLLAGPEAEASGVERAQVALTPGPQASLGGGQLVHEVRIEVRTDALAAWRSALEELVGAHGTVTTSATGADAGLVTASILPPAGTPPGTPAVELRLHAVRHQVGLAERGAG